MTEEDVALPELVESRHLADAGYISVTQDTIRFADGSEAQRAVVHHPGAVALVALDEQDRWLLVRQYRHPARGHLLEIPAGTRDEGEEPEVTAAREMREETGYAAANLVPLGGTWMAPGFCEEYVHYFLATGLREDPLPPDEDEHLSEPVRLTLEEIEAAIDAGEIEDAKTLVAVTLLRRYRDQYGPFPG